MENRLYDLYYTVSEQFGLSATRNLRNLAAASDQCDHLMMTEMKNRLSFRRFWGRNSSPNCELPSSFVHTGSISDCFVMNLLYSTMITNDIDGRIIHFHFQEQAVT